MHIAPTTETPDFFKMQVLSDYPCTVVRYHAVRYGTVLYKVTNMSRGRFSIGDKLTKVNPSCYHKQTYCTVHYSICQVDFPYGTVHYLFCFMRPVVVFYHYPWNNQVFYYGTVQYSIALYRTVGLIHFSRLLIHFSR